MKVICHNTNCEYYDNNECGIVKDGLDTLEISDNGDCLNFEYKDGEGE